MMSDEIPPKLTLGEPPKGLRKKTVSGSRGLLYSVLFLQLVLVAMLLFDRPGASLRNRSALETEGTEPDLRSVAMALEERSLDREAALAWERLLADSPDLDERPQILYRIGKLFMQAGEYERAAAALVQADLAAGDDQDLKEKTGPRMVECLRKLGLYGEVSRELSRRVEVGGGDRDGSRVLATLAGDSITEADLDRMIERRVDQMLAVQGVGGDEMQRKGMIDQLRTPEMAAQVFQEMLQSELFSRRAREMKLDQEEGFQQTREMLEEQLLASRFLRQHLEKIQPSPVDIESYYQAFKEEYKDEETDEVLPFEQVREQVLNDYLMRKRQEMAEKLFRDLMVRYDLKMVSLPGRAPATETPGEPGNDAEEEDDGS